MGKVFTGFAIFIMLFTGCGVVTKGALHSARSNLEDRDYNEALSDLTEANFSGLDESQKPEVAFLRANALYGVGRVDEAKAVLNFIIKKYPESKYPPQARSLIKKWARSDRSYSEKEN